MKDIPPAEPALLNNPSDPVFLGLSNHEGPLASARLPSKTLTVTGVEGDWLPKADDNRWTPPPEDFFISGVDDSTSADFIVSMPNSCLAGSADFGLPNSIAPLVLLSPNNLTSGVLKSLLGCCEGAALFSPNSLAPNPAEDLSDFADADPNIFSLKAVDSPPLYFNKSYEWFFKFQ